LTSKNQLLETEGVYIKNIVEHGMRKGKQMHAKNVLAHFVTGNMVSITSNNAMAYDIEPIYQVLPLSVNKTNF
jgi:hypothetical protein